MVNTYDKDKINYWKGKTKIANSEKNKFAKKNRRLEARVASLTLKNKALKQEVAVCKKAQQQLGFTVDASRAERHQFALVLVLFCVHCQRFGMTSLRSCQNMVAQLVLVFGLRTKVPSHTTIRNWVCKCGYHRGVTQANLAANSAGQSWALWVDESISVGGQKILLVLGRTATDWSFDKSLTQETVHVLHMSFAEQWLGEEVATVLQEIAQTHKIAYIVSDMGNNLTKSYKIGGFTHISDLTHTIAKGLERHYKTDEDFQTFFKTCAAIRQKWSMSKSNSVYMPPCQRGKVRFANIFPVIEWAYLLLPKHAQLPANIQAELAFVWANEALIHELYEVHRTIGEICKLLKTSGFSAQHKTQVEVFLAALSDKPCLNAFAKEINTWLDNTESARQKIGLETIFCCSDIIESTFGKFKQKINTNSSFGMTEFVLTIANFGQNFSKHDIISALEQATLQKIADWRPKCQSVFKKKQAFFQA